jgi:hypothetical protein
MLQKMNPNLAAGLPQKVAILIAIIICSGGFASAQTLSWDEEAVKSLCADEWTDDFTMQAYCVEQNKKGFEGFSRLATKSEFSQSFEKCKADWDIKWDMVRYCAEQQVAGLTKIPAIIKDIPSDVGSKIVNKCTSEWDPDFNMIAYCAERATEGWRQLNN